MDKATKIEKLIEALEQAQIAASEAVKGEGDGGTCNLDSVVIRIRRWRDADFEKLNESSAVEISTHKMESSWWKGFRWVGFLSHGQGHRRTVGAEAACASLKKSCEAIFDPKECDVFVYYQMD